MQGAVYRTLPSQNLRDHVPDHIGQARPNGHDNPDENRQTKRFDITDHPDLLGLSFNEACPIPANSGVAPKANAAHGGRIKTGLPG